MTWYLRLKNTGRSTFANNFAPSKDVSSIATPENAPIGPNQRSLYFTDGGSDVFDGWGYFTAAAGAGAYPLTYPDLLTSPDGQVSQHLLTGGSDDQQIQVRVGWAAQGILTIEYLAPGINAARFFFGGNLGSDGQTQYGVVTKDFAGPNSGASYRLHTVWSNDGGMDAGGDDPQLTRTFVPTLGTNALVAAGSKLTSTFGDQGAKLQESSLTDSLAIGGTLFIQWGFASVDAVQSWIIANLEETENHPFPAPVEIAYRSTRPYTKLPHNWPTSPVGARALPPRGRIDVVDGGALRIAGTVAIDDSPDVPVSRRVRLFDQVSARVVRETWSAADGSYAFDKLADRKYFVVAHDHTLTEQAAIKDQISPEVPT